MKMKKIKKKTAIIAAAMALVIVVGTAAALFAFRPAVKIAARSSVIELWRSEGVDKALEQELRIRIQWLDYGSDAESVYQRVLEDLEKSAARLPDVYLGLGLESRQISALIAQNALLEIGAMEEYTPNLRRVMDSDTSRIPEMITDGGIYSFPSLREDLASVYPQKAWINVKWLAASGHSMPSDPKQLHTVLSAFKTLDGNGNGIADEVPLGAACSGGSSLGFLVQPYITTDYDFTDSNYLNIEAGKVYAGVSDPKFKDALAYLHALYAEGLMDKNVFAQSSAELKRTAGGGETYGVILAKDIVALLGEARAADYAPLPPLSNNGRSSTLVRRASVKTGGCLIPARISEARQKRALALGDAMLSEQGTQLVSCEGSRAVYSTLRGEVPCWEITGDEVTQTWYAPVGERCIANALPVLTLDAQHTEELKQQGVYRKVIDVITSRTRAFVTGEKNLDGEWTAYLDELDAAGLQKMIQYTQEAYDKDRN